MNSAWYTHQATDEGPILSSRIRLARNLRKFPFQQKLNTPSASEMVQEISNTLDSSFHKLDMHSLAEAEQKVFLEKHIVSPEFLRSGMARGLVISHDQNESVMLNEEDHIRIQAVQPGDALAEAMTNANRIDDAIEATLEYAFHPEYGYLTACPTNTGTGLRASYMIHLPFLERVDKFKSLLPAIAKFGITLRGIYGEGTESMGGIYQISNQTTLGKTEEEIIEVLQNMTRKVMEHEANARDKMLGVHRADQENIIYRAYGVLAYSRKITTKEAMDLLSEIRLGYVYNLLNCPKPDKQIYQIMMEIQSGHLQRAAGREMDEVERDYARAEYLRGIFG